MKAILALAVAATTMMIAASAPAADVEAPSGPVVLTVAGDIANTNRSAYDENSDVFFRYHEQAFDRAFEFDLAMLEGLGMTEVRVEYRDWNAPIDFSGPRLADVLSAAGCGSGPLVTLALDGFATEMAAAEIETRSWVLATRADGRPHSIGGRGPLWLVFDPPGDRPATEEEENMWPWALFFIECG